MTFGWQGFQFDHPDDWAPASMRGSEREGYARVASSGRLAAHIRWQRSQRSLGFEGVLEKYLAQLEKEARRAREPFRSKTSIQEPGVLTYHWTGAGQGRGVIFFSEPCSRIFLLEIMGGRKDSLLPHLQGVRESFASTGSATALWSLLGMQIRLPDALRLEGHSFQAGKTELCFSKGRARIQCTRWGFAEQLLQRYSLVDWAKASLGLARTSFLEEPEGLRFASRSILDKKEALVALQPEHNQIITVKATYRNEMARPSWDWIS